MFGRGCYSTWVRVLQYGQPSSLQDSCQECVGVGICMGGTVRFGWRGGWEVLELQRLDTATLARARQDRWLLISVMNQLDAQNFCFTISFISCIYMFRAPCAYHQEVKILLRFADRASQYIYLSN